MRQRTKGHTVSIYNDIKTLKIVPVAVNDYEQRRVITTRGSELNKKTTITKERRNLLNLSFSLFYPTS